MFLFFFYLTCEKYPGKVTVKFKILISLNHPFISTALTHLGQYSEKSNTDLKNLISLPFQFQSHHEEIAVCLLHPTKYSEF